MVIVLHILSALGGLIAGGVAYFRPGIGILHITSSLAAATILSGTYLVFSRHLNILSVCISGLFYLSAIGVLLALGRRRLAKNLAG